MWDFKYKNEFEACVAELDRHPDVQAMRAFPQHTEGVSTYDHCVLVAYSSFRLCKLLGLTSNPPPGAACSTTSSFTTGRSARARPSSTT